MIFNIVNLGGDLIMSQGGHSAEQQVKEYTSKAENSFIPVKSGENILESV